MRHGTLATFLATLLSLLLVTGCPRSRPDSSQAPDGEARPGATTRPSAAGRDGAGPTPPPAVADADAAGVHGSTPGGAPPRQAAIGPEGGTVGVPGAALAVPPGAVASAVEISIAEERPDLALLTASLDADYRAALASDLTTLRVLRLGPDGQQFAAPATLTVEIEADDLPAGKTLADVAVVLVSGDEVIDLPARPVPGGLAFDVPHCSFAALVVAAGLITIAGLAASYVRGATEPMMRKDCASWLDPSGRVGEIANDKERFFIDTTAGSMKLYLDKPIVGKEVGQGNHLMRPKNLIDHPEGDCVNMSSLYGSMLLARGYPVRLVSGNAVYRRGGKVTKGLHQWAETVIDGKAYYVDTFDADKPRLIPLAEATTSLSLTRGRMCGKDPDGTEYGSRKYAFRWFENLKPGDDTAALVRRYKEMQETHRSLNAACNSGDEAACKERRAVYLEAMELRKQLNAKGIDPTK